jgi:hypothetical protein
MTETWEKINCPLSRLWKSAGTGIQTYNVIKLQLIPDFNMANIDHDLEANPDSDIDHIVSVMQTEIRCRLKKCESK